MSIDRVGLQFYINNEPRNYTMSFFIGDDMWGDSAKIQDFETSEDIWNNSVYVIDRNTQKIKVPKSVDDWMHCETVLVYNMPGYGRNGEDRFLIKAGTMCRCWRIWIQFY